MGINANTFQRSSPELLDSAISAFSKQQPQDLRDSIGEH